MNLRSVVPVYRVVFALLTLFAIGYQFVYLAGGAAFKPANFFSFFTIQSNLFAAAVLLVGALWKHNDHRSPRFDLVRGAAVLYLTITGIVYGVLLSGYQEALQTTLPWVDTILHRIMPLVMVADWLIAPPNSRLRLRQAAIWLVYPLIYCVYSLVRGPIVDWYPYPFLDPDATGGYPIVALYCVGIAIVALGFAWLVVLMGRRVRVVLQPTPA